MFGYFQIVMTQVGPQHNMKAKTTTKRDLHSVKPRNNEPLYNEVLSDITNDFLYPSNSKIYEKEPSYSEQILSVPWPFVLSRFHCTYVH